MGSGECDGTLKKTTKASLSTHIEKQAAFVDLPTGTRAAIIDAMGIIQKIHGDNCTFGELSGQILKSILNHSCKSQRVDEVFDVYTERSIKNAERDSRGAKDSLFFHDMKLGYRIKNWKHLLGNTESKNRLTRFLAESWKEEKVRKSLGEVTLIVSVAEKCFEITKDTVREVPELTCSHKEAETRLVLHARHATGTQIGGCLLLR